MTRNKKAKLTPQNLQAALSGALENAQERRVTALSEAELEQASGGVAAPAINIDKTLIIRGGTVGLIYIPKDLNTLL